MKAIKKNMSNQYMLPISQRQILHCPSCNGEWSGNPGDYWNLPDDHVFKCSECDVELELVRKVINISYTDDFHKEEVKAHKPLPVKSSSDFPNVPTNEQDWDLLITKVQERCPDILLKNIYRILSTAKEMMR